MAKEVKMPAKPKKPRAKAPPKRAPTVADPLDLIVDRTAPHANLVENLRAVPRQVWPRSAIPDIQVPTYTFDTNGDCVKRDYYPYYISELQVENDRHSTKHCDEQDEVLTEWVIVKVIT
jgi:hypothetical protein